MTLLLNAQSSGVDRTIKATKRGAFAVHHTTGAGDTEYPGWSVTHIQTARSVMGHLCCKASALALADAVAKIGKDWDFDMPHTGFPSPPRGRKQQFKLANKLAFEWQCPKHARKAEAA